ncbi:RidA family protein [Paraferrimonas sedimenticola]|uniref:Endoribonuclease L-PSP n=1 Tax=Paraferrimonas sedimenticola TaxID=375674 RepID=A0AA37W1C5_9GAMM|nr:RidA family protein [Paraferrimonas sedimenticola]GLP96072.1 endoribonuclease L-PSP [Paraferrimonas sedimenticola]
MKTSIISDKAPAAIGPYCHVTTNNGVAYTSGQLPIIPETGKFPSDDVAEQSKQALENLKTVLEAAGSSLEQVLKTTCYLADINDFAAFNEVYKQYFVGDCPARSCFQVGALPMAAKIEIEAIAVCD